MERRRWSFGRVVEVLYGEVSYADMPRIMWLSALLCAIIGGFWLLDSLKDTVLATTVGLEYQPRAKLLSVCVTLVVVSAYNALIDRASKPTLFYAVGFFYAVVFVVLGGFLSHKTIGMENTVASPSRWLGWVTYFAIESYGSLAVALFWAFTNASVELEEAKSSYGLIVAFAQVGAIVGSTLATQARSLHVSFLFVLGGASCLSVCAMVKGYVYFFQDYHSDSGRGLASPTASSRPPSSDSSSSDDSDAEDDNPEDDDDDDQYPLEAAQEQEAAKSSAALLTLKPHRKKRKKTSSFSSEGGENRQRQRRREEKPMSLERRLFDGFELVLRHSYVTSLLAISTLYEVVLTVLDFEMKIMGRARYGSDTRGAEEFAGLMGNFGQFVNTVSFFFALGGFSFVVRALGLPSTLLVFPSLLVLATLVAYAFPSLLVLFVTTAVLKALTYSLNEPALEMLYAPTSEAIKFKAKAWIDVVGARSAKAAGSAINDIVQRSPYLRDNVPQYGNVPGFLIAIILLVVSMQVGAKFETLVEQGTIVGANDDRDPDFFPTRASLDARGNYQLAVRNTKASTLDSEDLDNDDKNIFSSIAEEDNR